MDQQLKQRLIGVSIIVALSVIFIPMLFDKSEDKGKITSSGIPPIPEDVLEKPLELPKTAEELAPKEKTEAPVETGYRIVPLTDEPSKNKEPAKATKPSEEGAHEESIHIVDPDEEKPKSETEKPVRAMEQNQHAGEAGNAVAIKPIKANVKPKAEQETKKPKAGKFHSLEVDGDEEDLPIPEPAKLEPAPHTKKLKVHKPSPKPAETEADEEGLPIPAPAKVEAAPQTKKLKVHKPNPKPAETDGDEEDLPIPAPAKMETTPETQKPKVHKPGSKPAETVRDEAASPAPAKPKNSTAAPLKPVEPQHRSATKTEKPETAEMQTPKPTAPPTTPHPTPASKPSAAEKTKPAKAEREEHPPSSNWVLQAGSFTNESKARSLAEKLRQSNPSVHVETIHGANGSFHKVLIGPESDRSRVEQIQKQVENETGIKGMISPR